MFRLRKEVVFTTCLLTAFLLSDQAAEAVSRATACSNATTVSSNTTLHDYGSAVSELKVFKIVLSGTGVLTLDAFAPGDEAVAPKLSFLGTDCETPANGTGSHVVVEALPSSARVEITAAGTFYFQLVPDDLASELSGYKLRNAFLSTLSSLDETTTPSTDPSGTCSSSSTPFTANSVSASRYARFSEDVDEWDGDIMGIASEVPGILRLSASGADLSAYLYAGQTCPMSALLGEATLATSTDQLVMSIAAGDYRLKIKPYNGASGSYSLDLKLYDVCAQGESDDHGDSPLCASPQSLTSAGSGEISATNDDDDDFFTFVLASTVTVEIKSTGSLDTFGSLYGAGGNRLATADGGGSGSNFKIVKTLSAGRYFVRVEGKDGAEGSYGLSVTVLTEP